MGVGAVGGFVGFGWEIEGDVCEFPAKLGLNYKAIREKWNIILWEIGPKETVIINEYYPLRIY